MPVTYIDIGMESRVQLIWLDLGQEMQISLRVLYVFAKVTNWLAITSTCQMIVDPTQQQLLRAKRIQIGQFLAIHQQGLQIYT